MTQGPAFEVEGIREVRLAFGRAGQKRELDRALRAAHKDIAKNVEKDARATPGTAQQRKAIKAILGKGEPEAAIIALRNTAGVPFGIGSFMGALAWKQFPAWVGQNWDIEAGDGPYVVAAAIARDLPKIADTYETEIGRVIESVGLNVT